MTVPRCALLVSSSGDSAETVSCSVTPPTASCTLMVAVSLTSSRSPVREYFWKPGISTASV
jgi:hypothetical protein